MVRRTSFLEIGGLDASPLLQREFDADFWLRSVRQGQKGLVRAGSLAEARWTWEDFPLQTDFRVPRYLSHSYRVRTAGQAAATAANWLRAGCLGRGRQCPLQAEPRTSPPICRRTVAADTSAG